MTISKRILRFDIWVTSVVAMTFPSGREDNSWRQKGDVTGKIVGNWSLNWIFTYASGQPLTIPCTLTTAAGVGCDALSVQGAKPSGGPHNANQYWNPASFYNPPQVVSTGQANIAPLGGAPTQVYGPNLIRLDAALRRSFQIERIFGLSSVRKLTMY